MYKKLDITSNDVQCVTTLYVTTSGLKTPAKITVKAEPPTTTDSSYRHFLLCIESIAF